MQETNNVLAQKKLNTLEKKTVVHSSDILPGSIQQRHLSSGLYSIKFGLAADRPTAPGEDGEFFAYLATNTNVLSCWNGTAWVSTTLS